jgi:hypothetical protein
MSLYETERGSSNEHDRHRKGPDVRTIVIHNFYVFPVVDVAATSA